MIYNIFSTMICIILPILVFRKSSSIKKTEIKKWILENKYQILIYIVFVIGFMIRTINIENFPNGLNCDEASSGYEAYSIGNYGIDRNGKFLPVFLISWGSGQNALYSYMIIPFVKIFGLNVLTTRLPMAILSCVSLVIMYKLLRLTENKKMALIGLAFFSICPWHIMKSRWGLESNVFPDLMLIAVFLIILSIKNKREVLLYIGFGVLGLCAYAYGTSYFFLPFFIIPLLIYLIYKQKITIKRAAICLTIVFIIALPIIIYIFINTFDLPEIKYVIFTVPRTTSNRYEEISSVFSKNFINNSINNFVESIKILVFQTDRLPWNAIKGIGITYIFSLPFTMIGVFSAFKNKKDDYKFYKSIINIWFVAAILLLFVCEPNINRINIIMIPIIYYTILGIYEIICFSKKTNILIIGVYGIAFIIFLNLYANINFDNYLVFTDGISDVIKFVDNLDVDTVYMQYSYKEPYIYTLFYTETNPYEFISTVEYKNHKSIDFENVKSFGKYKYYLPEVIEPNERIAYIVSKNNKLNIDYSKWKITEFEKFIVLTY